MRTSFVRSTAFALLVLAGPVLAQMPTAPAAKTDDPMICKKTVETGSLVKKKKLCMTKSEWVRVQISQREGAEKTVDQLTGGYNCSGGGC